MWLTINVESSRRELVKKHRLLRTCIFLKNHKNFMLPKITLYAKTPEVKNI